MRPTYEFTIDDFQFRLTALSPLESIELMPTVLDILPAVNVVQQSMESGNSAATIAAMRRCIVSMPQVLKAFRGSCQVAKAPEAPVFQPLDSIFDNVFRRQQEVMLKWAFTCIKQEYGDFLAKSFQDPKEGEGKADASG